MPGRGRGMPGRGRGVWVRGGAQREGGWRWGFGGARVRGKQMAQHPMNSAHRKIFKLCKVTKYTSERTY